MKTSELAKRTSLLLAFFLSSSAVSAESLGIRIVVNCRDCLSMKEIDIASVTSVPRGEPLTITSSRLFLMDEQGMLLASISDPYRNEGKVSEFSGSTSGVLSLELERVTSKLPAGSYMAVWRVNGSYSNVVRFSVKPELQGDIDKLKPNSCQGSLHIEPLVDIHGRAEPDAFLAYFRNGSADSVILPSLWAHSRLLVDGKAYRLGMLMWMGLGDLWPGKSWATDIDLDSFVGEHRERIAPGVHVLQYQFGDCLSNVIQIKVEELPPAAGGIEVDRP